MLPYNMDVCSFLAQTPLFKGLPPEHLRKVSAVAVPRSYARGETIFSEGEKGQGFYIVVTGRVKISKVSPEGKEQVLHIIGFQEPIGEVAVFAGENFPAHAHAFEESTLLFFPRQAFLDLIASDPFVAMNMLAILSRRLRQFTRLVEELSLKEVPVRLASYLTYLSEKQGGNAVDLDVPRTVLAALLGTIPETLSRILSKMAAEGVIRVEGRHIEILDPAALEELSSGMR